jgi:hypothetical protein
MRQRISIPFLALLTASLLLGSALPCLAGEGFGMLTKKTVTLDRLHPPKVFLSGTKISVKVTSLDVKEGAAAQRVQSELESELLRNDSRLSSDATRPQTLIEVTLLRSAYAESMENRRLTELRQTTNASGKSTLVPVAVDVPFKVVSHSSSATYKVTDSKTRKNLASDTVKSEYKNSFREGKDAPSSSALEEAAYRELVERLVRDLTATRETIKVLLPQGSLESIGNLAEARQWNKYLEAVESLPARSIPQDDSYRKYALGVAYEALGYGADDPETILKYLGQASSYYNEALESNPKEKYFAQAYESILTHNRASAPLERVRSALIDYRKVKEQRDSLAQASPAADETLAGAKALGGKAVAGDVMTNASVIKMAEAGLSDEIILGAINSAPKTAFDGSADGLIALSEAKASKRVILRIQEIVAKGADPKGAAANKRGRKTAPAKPHNPPGPG